jgi:hypothetical protein
MLLSAKNQVVNCPRKRVNSTDHHSPWLDEDLVGCVETDVARYTGIDKCVLFA